MKVLIVILVIAGAVFLGWKLTEQWQASKTEEEGKKPVITAAASTPMPGMRDSLEPALAEAQRKGTVGLRAFLDRYGKYIQDPKLGAIELDYAVLMLKENPVEAKKVFARVKARTPLSSPIYERVKLLEKTYE